MIGDTVNVASRICEACKDVKSDVLISDDVKLRLSENLPTEEVKNFEVRGRNKKITLHSSCHSRAQNIGPKSAQILNLIPNTVAVNVEKCSGHGGTWGVKKKWNKTARKVGLNAAKQVFKDKDVIIASTCPLAGLHLKDINESKNISNYDDKIYHPIELIAKSYGL